MIGGQCSNVQELGVTMRWLVVTNLARFVSDLSQQKQKILAKSILNKGLCGRYRIRTYDPLLVRQVL